MVALLCRLATLLACHNVITVEYFTKRKIMSTTFVPVLFPSALNHRTTFLVAPPARHPPCWLIIGGWCDHFYAHYLVNLHCVSYDSNTKDRGHPVPSSYHHCE